MTPVTEHRSLVGHHFAEGHLRILQYEDWLLRDAIGAPTTGNRPHAGWTLLGSFRGMGADLTEIYRVLGATQDDGVMFGESHVEQSRPLEYERDYRVTSEIVDVRRCHGAKIAVFDLVTYLVGMHDDEGLAVRCRNTFVVPRRST